MARLPKENKEKNILTPQEQALSYLKDNKNDHYNFEKTHDYKVPASSLQLTYELGGGLTPGAHRAVGITRGGKSSQSLDFMFNFFKEKKRRGLYVKSEGRLSKEMRDRTGIKYVFDPVEWEDGTCLVFECNIFEVIFGFIKELITNNPLEIEYFFIFDSLDSMIRHEDVDKPFDEAARVAGGPLITSVFLKKVGLALAKRGHIGIFISQVRDEIKLNQYVKTLPRQGQSAGGFAIQHQADVVMDFQPRFGGDLIQENPSDKNSKIVGHFVKVQLLKTNNEKDLVTVKYPVKYWRTGGNSVWIEQEIVDLMLMWNLLEKSGSWLSISQTLIDELKSVNINMPDKLQGIDNVRKWLEDNPDATKFLYNKFSQLIKGE